MLLRVRITLRLLVVVLLRVDGTGGEFRKVARAVPDMLPVPPTPVRLLRLRLALMHVP